MKIKEILKNLEMTFPLEKQEPWDHSGLQVGNIENECTNILVCLNVDAATIQQAIEHHCNLIISHHPFLFHPIHTLDFTTIRGNNIKTIVDHNLTVYSMHTNYDALAMNKIILENLGCVNIQTIDTTGILRSGRFLNDLNFNELINKLKTYFNLDRIRYCGIIPENIKTIALCAGSGHDFIQEALAQVDVFITGDLTYTHAMDIIEMKKGCVIELPHFIEEEFKKDIIQYLPEHIVIAKEEDYFKTI